MNLLKDVLDNRLNQRQKGVYCCCSANEMIIRSVLKNAKQHDYIPVIESTANQVDQNGGYTGMTPQDFVNLVKRIAKEEDFDFDKIILGGDHLGPLTVASKPEAEAMAYASELVKHYAQAGYNKIHIDTSMKIGDDQDLSDEVIARRALQLMRVCEANKVKQISYIVGSEVPIPGGAQEETKVMVTNPDDFRKTMETFKDLFTQENELELFEKIVAVVVQPGVEERDGEPERYDRERAKDLTNSIHEYKPLVFEGHSTDYQTKVHLKEMVEDNVAILKVGPGFSFALREALFALSYIEKLMIEPEKQSHFMEVLEDVMVENDKNWKKYYFGSEFELKTKRGYSFSDRNRYYFPHPRVQEALTTLKNNVNKDIPLNLLSQFAPIQYKKVILKELNNSFDDIVSDWVQQAVNDYVYAILG